jgi:uncharacterized protein YlxP (DUF503 family)
MAAGTIDFELFLPRCRSLKEKRALIRPIIDGARSRFRIAIAEVDHQDLHQRAALTAAAVSSSHGHVESMLDSVERWVWSRPEVEVVSSERHWVDPDP